MFTKDNTFNEIMNTEPNRRALGNLFPSCWIRLVPGDKGDLPMKRIEQEVKMEWGGDFLSDAFVECANVMAHAADGMFSFVPLWERHDKGWIPDADLNDRQGVYLFTGNPDRENLAFAYTSSDFSVPPYKSEAVPEDERSRDGRRPAVIICPGGGYEMLSAYSEGIQLAQRFERDGGYKAFVLSYRLRPWHYPDPQSDLALAVMYVRAHADEYGVDPQKIVTVGASAGGHLCASEALLHEELKQKVLSELDSSEADRLTAFSARPDGICLLYPVISFTSEYHEGSFMNNTGGDETLRRRLSVELHDLSGFPPVYSFANRDDGCVPCSNTTRLGDELEKCRVPHLCELFPSGDHGCGLGYGASCARWSEDMLSFFEQTLA